MCKSENIPKLVGDNAQTTKKYGKDNIILKSLTISVTKLNFYLTTSPQNKVYYMCSSLI